VYRVKKEGAFGGYKVLTTVLWHTVYDWLYRDDCAYCVLCAALLHAA
jgi:hypothetical protein